MNYHEDNIYLTSTKFRHFLKYGRLATDKISSKSLDIGSLCHLKFLEPYRYSKYVRVTEAIDRRTSAGKEAYLSFQKMAEDNPEFIWVTEQDNKIANDCTTNLLKQESVVKVLEQAIIEKPIFGQISSVSCKCRPDILKGNILLDYKTTNDVLAFKYSIAKYSYDIQMAFYCEVLASNGIFIEQILFIVQESLPPYDFKIFELSQEKLLVAKVAVHEGIEKYKIDLVFGWSGYDKSIEVI